MKKLLTVFIIGLAGFCFAEDWTFDSVFLDLSDTLNAPVAGHFTTGFPPGGIHGVVVAPDGNIWVSLHDGYGVEFTGYNHSTGTPDTICHYKPIYVLDPTTGDHVSYSPITHLTFPDGSIDTLYAESIQNGSGKGISLDRDGNILYTSWSTVYRINYLTGEGMNKFTPWDDMNAMTEAVQDENGLIYVGYVISASRPVYILDNNFTLLGNATDTLGHINRTLAVSSDGTDLFAGSTWTGFGIEHWHSDIPGVLPYTVVDTFGVFTDVPVAYDYVGSAVGDSTWIMVDPSEADSTVASTAIWPSSLDISPQGVLWAGALTAVWGGPMGGKYYGYDPNTYELIDEAGVQHGDYAVGGTDGPRGAAWTASGNTMYLADFYTNQIAVWTNSDPVTVGIDDHSDNPIIAKGFILNQNYPNPFNPVTKIPFEIKVNGVVKLIVYDMLGQEVTRLLNKPMVAGSHEVLFDATGFATGIYFYRITVDNRESAKKMIYIK